MNGTHFPTLWNRLFSQAPTLLPVFFLVLMPCRLFALLPWLTGHKLELASNGTTSYVILLAEQAIPAELFAAEELSNHLEQICGVPFAIRGENESPDAGKAIYVGQTEFARSQGIDFAGLGVEEWVLRTCGEHIILSGGRPRGTLYAVYEFLENELGCHWFDAHNQVIPKQPVLKIKPFSRQEKPTFSERFIFSGMHSDHNDHLLRTRNKDTKQKPAKYGFGYGIDTHNFWVYMQNFPDDKAEFRALDKRGERPLASSGIGPGQICLTHPGARQNVLQQLRQRIQQNRAEVANANDGQEPKKVFGITPNDIHWICQCNACQELCRNGQGDSAALLDFINFLADNIKDEYPDILLETWAYTNTSKPPVNIRPRDNVLVRVIQLTGEWVGNPLNYTDSNYQPEMFPDMFRSRKHPVNRTATDLMETWCKISRQNRIWGYWVFYRQGFLSPWVNLRSIHQDMLYYKRLGMNGIFIENEIKCLNSFYTLKTWVGWKLMQDPSQKLQNLLDIFMPGYYGPAAKPMLAYLNHLEDSIATVPAKVGNLSAIKTSQRPYLTLDFFRKSQQLLDEAEALAAADSRYSLNVQQERILVDSAVAVMWQKLEKELRSGETMPCNFDDVLNRYQRNCQRLTEQRKDLGLRASLESSESLLQKSDSFLLMEKDPPSLTVPRIANARGDTEKVAWEQAAPINQWVTKFGREIPERKVRGAMAHDGEFLYLLLEESGLDTSKLSPIWWGGDGWEIFLRNQDEPLIYRQLAINLYGEFLFYEYPPQKNVPIKAKVVSHKTDDCWQTCLTVPLKDLLPHKLMPGDSFSLNIFRHTKFRPGEHLCWSPIFEAGYHDLERLGRIILTP